jgi:predicted nucleic acid-binding protein
VIILDTNIISEVMRPRPTQTVLDWLNHQSANELWLSVISIAEIEYDLRSMPVAKRRTELSGVFERFIARAFSGRILSFEQNAAHLYGDIMSERKALGRPMSMADGQIAATARAHGYAVATRNTEDFVDCGLELLNPFNE